MVRLRLAHVLRASLFALAVAGLAAVPARGHADDLEPCTIALKGEGPIVKACLEGGVPQARRAMREMVRAARAKGGRFECNDCHAGADEWRLSHGAAEKFRRLLELSK